MRFSETLTSICTALAKVQAEIKNPIKNQVNKGVQGAPKYANLEDTLQDYVRPICTKHGISIFQPIKTDEAGRVGVCTVLFHESGEFIEGDYVFCDVVIPISQQGKKILTEGQATGVCITYLRRYSLNAALGINGDKDTDGSYSNEPLDDITPPTRQQPQRQQQHATGAENACSNCGTPITAAVANYSVNNFGAPLCITCQKQAKAE